MPPVVFVGGASALIGRAIIGDRASRLARRQARQQAHAERRAERQRVPASSDPMRRAPTQLGAFFVHEVTIENGRKIELVRDMSWVTPATAITEFKRSHWADDVVIANGQWPYGKVKNRHLYQVGSNGPVLWAVWDHNHPEPSVVQQQAELRRTSSYYANR